MSYFYIVAKVLLCQLLLHASHLSVAPNENLQLQIKPSGAVQHKAINDNLIWICRPSNDQFDTIDDKTTLQWTFNDGQIVNDRRKYTDDIEGGQGLFIAHIRKDDEGRYECLATVDGTQMKSVVELKTFVAPHFLNTPHTNLTSWLNNIINITCLATSIPNATIEWNAPNKVIDRDPYYRQFGSGPMSSLQVTPIDGSYFGKYKCIARNTHGTSEHEVNLNEAFAPGKLFQIVFGPVTANTITFSFLGPRSDGGLDIDGYSVRYIEDGQSWSDRSDPEVIIKERQWPVPGPFILDKLKPEKKYHFKFAAKNKVGFGDWSCTESIVMPKKSSPEVPTFIRMSENEVSPYPDKYTVQWIAPANNGDNITSFLITYESVKNKSGVYETIEDFKSQDVPYPEETNILLTRLQSDSIYRITVRALNSIGYSRPGVLIMRTAKGSSIDDANNDHKMSQSGMIIDMSAYIIARLYVAVLTISIGMFL